MQVATPLADLTEKEWQAQVVELARTLGWRHYHTYRSKRSPSGFPDLVLVRDRVVFLELKREKGKLTDDQKGWLRALEAAHAEAYVVRPRDLEALAAILACRGNPRLTTSDRSAYAGWRALREATLEESA